MTMIMLHDDDCGEFLDHDGMCPRCKFHPDGQSTAFQDVSEDKVLHLISQGRTLLGRGRTPIGTGTASMKIGDLVVVAQQPPNLLPKIVGGVGYIQGLLDGYAQIQTISLSGEYSGTGSVPEFCLKPEGRQEWIEAKRKHDEYKAKSRAEAKAHSDRVHRKEEELASRFGLSVSDVRTIVREVYALYSL